MTPPRVPSGRLHAGGNAPGGAWIALREDDLQRLRALLNTHSGKWQRRGDWIFMRETDDVDDGAHVVETRLARCSNDDVAELLVLLREWFWPLWNELVLTRKKLADAQKECTELTKLLKREGVFE